MVGPIRQALRVPVAIDTDVNGAALGEGKWGAGQGLDTFLYLTVGTGIGGGVIVRGEPLHGMLPPEMGHLRIPHNGEFRGACPFHGDCLEGLASGPAIEKRYGRPAGELPRTHEVWDTEAEHLSYALVNYIGTLSPQRIILGGGVMQQSHLFPKIRKRVRQLLKRYIRAEQLEAGIADYIVPPALGNYSGVLGAVVLASRAAGHSSMNR
jgi:fructokinase